MRRPRSLPDTVMAEIQRVFVKRNLKVGDRLPPERELARQLSVGRSSLREAMQGLQTMGMVEVRHGVGTFFTSEPSRWLLSPLRFSNTSPRRLFAELIEARLLVEVRLAALAAERSSTSISRSRRARDDAESSLQPLFRGAGVARSCRPGRRGRLSGPPAGRARRDSSYDRGARPTAGRRCPAGASARPSGGVSVHHRAVVDGA